ncbi:U6 snRNA-associated Sm-like protein LSm6 [Kluyveromyces marxianus]|uniref:U6 snRNA-associated Sm-like protein LSm6 n=1 Tax=Kluyveromyces marxianus TaxID=4911 RepID=A0ABX6EUJ7_KLUMA|nr:U6 snRNA-associated Sm-like protein LSm6 [Kluyveromyces marxianus]
METKTTASGTFLENIIGKPVYVKLFSGILYQGKLESIDGFMNVSLSQVSEHYETEENGTLHKYAEEVFLRGSQVLYISER